MVTFLPREIVCGCCHKTTTLQECRRGRGREYGEHPDHHFCVHCGQSIDWFGYRAA